MYVSTQSIQDVSVAESLTLQPCVFESRCTDPTFNTSVVPSKMNPVGDGDNQFAELFKAMPAARIGRMEDIAGAVIYLSSEAGVSGARMRFEELLC